MNLNAVAQRSTRFVEPPASAFLLVSTGYTQNPDYSRSPTYQAFPVVLDVQALTSMNIEHMDALNISGILRSIYFNGVIEGLNRPAGKGGDLVTFTSGRLAGTTWLCVQPLENWDTGGWVKVVIQLQSNPVAGVAEAVGAARAIAPSPGTQVASGAAAGAGVAQGVA